MLISVRVLMDLEARLFTTSLKRGSGQAGGQRSSQINRLTKESSIVLSGHKVPLDRQTRMHMFILTVREEDVGRLVFSRMRVFEVADEGLYRLRRAQTGGRGGSESHCSGKCGAHDQKASLTVGSEPFTSTRGSSFTSANSRNELLEANAAVQEGRERLWLLRFVFCLPASHPFSCKPSTHNVYFWGRMSEM